MMRLLDRFFHLAEHAVAEGVAPAKIAQMACVRPLQRLGEDIADVEPARFGELQAVIEREFVALTDSSESLSTRPDG